MTRESRGMRDEIRSKETSRTSEEGVGVERKSRVRVLRLLRSRKGLIRDETDCQNREVQQMKGGGKKQGRRRAHLLLLRPLTEHLRDLGEGFQDDASIQVRSCCDQEVIRDSSEKSEGRSVGHLEDDLKDIPGQGATSSSRVELKGNGGNH